MVAAVTDVAGGASQLEALFRAHYVALVRLAVVLTGNPAVAEELGQEAFARFHRSGARPRPGAELAYLRRTVVNLSHNHRGRVAFLQRVPSDVGTPPGTPEQEALASERRRAIAHAVRRLPPRQRDCVALHYFAELSVEEIADTIGVRTGSVKTHLHRARATLATRLEELR